MQLFSQCEAVIYKDLITSYSFLFPSLVFYLHYPNVLMQRTLLGTIRCLAEGHLPGDKCSFPHCHVGLCILIAFKLVSLPRQKSAVLRISCCKCVCDSTPWSISSSWLRNSKPLSLRTRHDLVYLERGLIKVNKTLCSLCTPIHNSL